MSAFNILLYGALFVCIVGLIYGICGWFVHRVGFYGRRVSVRTRLKAAFKAFLNSLFSLKIIKIFQTIIVDVVFQRRILVKAGFYRWLSHMLIFHGFFALVLMHALDDFITQPLFPAYYSTINPFLFLRSLFAAMVIAGLCMAIGRRCISGYQNVRTRLADIYALIIVAIIVFSGIFLEGLAMTAHSEFERMVYEYAGMVDEKEINAVESFWVANYALVSPSVKKPVDPPLLSLGAEMNDMYCMACHVSIQWGFSGYTVAKIIRPVAGWLDQMGGVSVFWYFHIVSCFLGLALLPFTKMFHLMAVPVSLVVGSVRRPGSGSPTNTATINAMALSACTHCGVCSQSCSAAMMFEILGNEYILPSEKMQALKKMIHRRKMTDRERKAVRQGIYVCTTCDRCTVSCPSGIRLRDLWISVREDFIQSDEPEPSILSPFSFVRGMMREFLTGLEGESEYEKPVRETLHSVCGDGCMSGKHDFPMILENQAFTGDIVRWMGTIDYAACFDCMNCTLICPVVAEFEDPEKKLGMLPHQIMCSLGWNHIKPASENKMIWLCLTCYKCQEHCPQNVPVCDLFYRLKNYASNQLEDNFIP